MKTLGTRRVYFLFIASPNGLNKERRVFRDAVRELTENGALRDGPTFVPTGFEYAVPGVGRPQGRTNQQLSKAHVLILILHDRWGSTSGSKGFSSGTIEELSVALDSLADSDKPMREIVILFKDVSKRQQRDPGPQLSQVQVFRQALDECKELQFGTFNSTEEFQRRLRSLFRTWSDSYSRDWPKRPIALPKLRQWIKTQRSTAGDILKVEEEASQAANQLEPQSQLAHNSVQEKIEPTFSTSMNGPTSRWRPVAFLVLLLSFSSWVYLVFPQKILPQRFDKIEMSVPILHLTNVVYRGPRKSKDVLFIPQRASRVVLEPTFANLPKRSNYQVALLAGESLLARSTTLGPEELEFFNFTLPCSKLPAGPLSLKVFGQRNGQEELIGMMEFTVVYN